MGSCLGSLFNVRDAECEVVFKHERDFGNIFAILTFPSGLLLIQYKKRLVGSRKRSYHDAGRHSVQCFTNRGGRDGRKLSKLFGLAPGHITLLFST